MQRRGYNTRARSLQGWEILLPLFASLLAIYLYLKKKIIPVNNMDLTIERVFLLLKNVGFNDTLASFMTAQGCHETAVNGVPFQSAIYIGNNNAFGMKYAGQVSAQGEKNGYAYYLNLENSVSDLASWYTRHRTKLLSTPLIIFTLSDYVRFLKNQKYFEADESEYLRGCQFFHDKLFAK